MRIVYSFRQAASNLDAQLLMIYRVAVLCAKELDDLDQVAKIWGVMVKFCDLASKKLQILCNEHPACGADPFYDRILDLRNKCQCLKDMHD